MRNRFTRFIFPILAVLLLAPWPIAYAYDNAAGEETARITVADTAKGPNGIVFGRARGGINPGELFYVDATISTKDISVSMQMTNVDELASFLSYLTLKVGVYRESNGQWEKAQEVNESPIPETLITMQDAEVKFNLPGGSKYKITIDGGNFYCRVINARDAVASPRFYLTVN